MTDFQKARPWTEDEYAFLLDMADLSNREAAEALDRTERAVERKRQKIRRGWAPTREHWEPEAIEFVRKSPHLTAEQVAAALGETLGRVQNQRKRLNLREGIRFHENRSTKSPQHIGSRVLLAKTCPKCGQFLPRRWFQFCKNASGGYWATNCKRCTATGDAVKGRASRRLRGSRNNHRKALQKASLATAERGHLEWTGADHEVLMDRNLSVIEKALRLSRSYYATQHVLHEHGYSSRRGLGSIESAWLIQFQNEES